MKRDPYDVLGISPDATPAEVRDAYLLRVRALHPDVNHEAGATSAFCEVQEAYAVLRGTRRRAADDASPRSASVPVDLPALREALAAAVATMISGRAPEIVIGGQRWRVRVVPG